MYEIISNNNASIGRIHKKDLSTKTRCKTNKEKLGEIFM